MMEICFFGRTWWGGGYQQYLWYDPIFVFKICIYMCMENISQNNSSVCILAVGLPVMVFSVLTSFLYCLNHFIKCVCLYIVFIIRKDNNKAILLWNKSKCGFGERAKESARWVINLAWNWHEPKRSALESKITKHQMKENRNSPVGT